MERIKNYQARETIVSFVDAVNRGDLQAALNTYEPNANLLIGKDRMAHGKKAIKLLLEEFMAQQPVVENQAQCCIEDTDTVVFCLRWGLKRNDFVHRHTGQQISISTKVVRRQKDGSWLISIDSPWGGDILGEDLD